VIKGVIIAVIAASALQPAVHARDFLVYFGTYTNALSQGIYVSRLDPATGNLSTPELAAETPSPCFLAVSPNARYLYAANSVPSFNGEKAGEISAFAIDRGTGHLSPINQKSSGGPGPCHVSTDASGNLLFAANYAGGSVISFKLDANGGIGADGPLIQHQGSSINASRQSSPHGHFIHVDPSNRYVLACDLGLDKIMIYKINAGSGALEKHSFATVPPGSGPRHLAFSADGKFAYVVNEMGCTVSVFAWQPEAGHLEPVESVSTLPSGVAVQPAFTAAEIVASGDRLYVTVRGHDSVSVFNRSGATGRLQLTQNIACGGKVPRGLGIDPTGRWLIVGNQKTDNAVEFSIDPDTGKLAPTGRELKMGSPVDVEFAEVK
jgi:6-phosphogluconolactonase